MAEKRSGLALGMLLLVVVGFLGLPVSAIGITNAKEPVTFQEYVIPKETQCEIMAEWTDQLLATYPQGTWAPMKFEPTDAQLAKMGLPSRDVLLSQRFPVPTMVSPDGTMEEVDLSPIMMGTLGPTVASYAGLGCLGIRPGAFLLLLNGGSIGWCSMAHVYGSPGTYKVSTAGHCGNNNDVATVIAAFGNRAGVLNPILLDFGRFSSSTGDAGIGKDWALVSVDSAWQSLVSPTMCFWGGPRGMYTKTGSTVAVAINFNNLLNPQVSTSTDPLIPQGLVHYGHGAGVGAGGTPRVGATIHWASGHYAFFGAITPGDSGSGTNTVGGDTIGATMEAAGINTHIYVDGSLKTGLGFLAGTRATLVSGTLADGQIVPYPAPAPGLP